jgi:hypothetical protein
MRVSKRHPQYLATAELALACELHAANAAAAPMTSPIPLLPPPSQPAAAASYPEANAVEPAAGIAQPQAAAARQRGLAYYSWQSGKAARHHHRKTSLFPITSQGTRARTSVGAKSVAQHSGGNDDDQASRSGFLCQRPWVRGCTGVASGSSAGAQEFLTAEF